MIKNASRVILIGSISFLILINCSSQILVLKKRNLYGLADINNKTLIEPIYKKIVAIDGWQNYFIAETESEWNILLPDGKFMFEKFIQGEQVSLGSNKFGSFIYLYSELQNKRYESLVIKTEEGFKLYHCSDLTMNIIENDTIWTCELFDQSNINVYLGSKGREIFKGQEVMINPNGSKCFALRDNDNLISLYSSNGNKMLTDKFNNSYFENECDAIILSKNINEKDFYTIVTDSKGEKLFKLDNTNIESCQKSYFTASKDYRNFINFIINRQGKEISIPETNKIIHSNSINFHVFENKQKLKGVYNANFNEVIKPTYQEIWTLGNSNVLLKKNNQFELKNLLGKKVDKMDGLSISLIDTAYLIVKRNEKFGMINGAGNIVIQVECDSIIKRERQEGFIVIKNKKYGVIDINGKVIIPIEHDRIFETDRTDDIYLVKGLNSYYYVNNLYKKSKEIASWPQKINVEMKKRHFVVYNLEGDSIGKYESIYKHTSLLPNVEFYFCTTSNRESEIMNFEGRNVVPKGYEFEYFKWDTLYHNKGLFRVNKKGMDERALIDYNGKIIVSNFSKIWLVENFIICEFGDSKKKKIFNKNGDNIISGNIEFNEEEKFSDGLLRIGLELAQAKKLFPKLNYTIIKKIATPKNNMEDLPNIDQLERDTNFVYGFIDSKGKFIIEPIFRGCDEFKYGYSAAAFYKHTNFDSISIIDKLGNIKASFKCVSLNVVGQNIFTKVKSIFENCDVIGIDGKKLLNDNFESFISLENDSLKFYIGHKLKSYFIYDQNLNLIAESSFHPVRVKKISNRYLSFSNMKNSLIFDNLTYEKDEVDGYIFELETPYKNVIRCSPLSNEWYLFNLEKNIKYIRN